MAAHSELYPPAIPFRTAARPSGAMLGGLALLVLIALLVPLGAWMGWVPAERFWSALLFNWLFWSSIAIGMVVLAVALHLTNARWAWSIRRFALGGVAFLPLSFLLLIPVFFGHKLFFHHWHPYGYDPVIEAKGAWLWLPGMIARDFIGLAILFGLAIWFAYHQLRPDVYGAGRTDAQRGWYERLTRGWRGVPEEAARSHHKMNVLGPIFALAYALIWGLIGIDLAMTTLPHFFSTMFPVTFFVSAFHSGLAMTIVMAVIFRKQLGLTEFITPRQSHDLGKLLFAFAVFWMYLNWSQYVVIWYGLLPHEQEFFALRFQAPYASVAIAVVMLVFVVPFFGLLTRPPKRVFGILAGFAVLIMIGHWLERFMITTPSYWQEPYVADATSLPLGLPEIAMGLGFGALFVGCYVWFISTFPVLPSPAALNAAGSGTVTVPGPTKVAEV
jgi:hypothetical protein